MKIIGLTGSIGMGKSTAAKILRVLKVPVFDSDACVHDLLAGAACLEIQLNFPESFDKKENTINRQILAQIIFTSPEAKTKLESILHPLVWSEQQKFIAKCRRAGFSHIILDIPLLFETGRDRICDQTICVTAPRFLQKTRVLSRPHMTPEKYASILASQLSDHDKRHLSHFVVQTGLGRSFTLQKLKKILRSGS